MLFNPRPQPAHRNRPEPAADVAQDASGVALQRAQHLAHAPELAGMGVTPRPGRQARGQAVVVLPQGDAGLVRQRHEGAARLLVEPAVGRVGDGLLHHRGVHRDLGEAARRHGP